MDRSPSSFPCKITPNPIFSGAFGTNHPFGSMSPFHCTLQSLPTFHFALEDSSGLFLLGSLHFHFTFVRPVDSSRPLSFPFPLVHLSRRKRGTRTGPVTYHGAEKADFEGKINTEGGETSAIPHTCQNCAPPHRGGGESRAKTHSVPLGGDINTKGRNV